MLTLWSFEYMEQQVYFSHTSYNCPKLKLYGYSSDRTIKTAIRRKLAKVGLSLYGHPMVEYRIS